MALRFLIGTGYVLVRKSFQNIQYHNIFKTKVTVNVLTGILIKM